jgi:hypothetical protein
VPLLFSVGMAYKGYFFCFHLLHIVVNNDILLRVIQVALSLSLSLYLSISLSHSLTLFLSWFPHLHPRLSALTHPFTLPAAHQQSVTKNGKSLLWVAALMIVIIYIYSLISFAFLRVNFHEVRQADRQTER